MTAVLEKTYTQQEALALEQSTGLRYEFIDGTLLGMAGETRLHKKVVLNILRILEPIALARGCEVMPEAKVRTQSSRYRYPDLVVSCAPGDDPYFLENPCFIVEVLSDSTALIDSVDKLEEYLRIPSLERYVLIEQQTRRVVVYKRTEAGWLVSVLDDSGELDVPCLATSLNFDQIYAGLR